MKLRHVVPVVAMMAGTLAVSGAGVSQAAGAAINPNTQTTTGADNARWTLSWSGGTGTFYPNWSGSFG